jgi:hypothetical protein
MPTGALDRAGTSRAFVFAIILSPHRPHFFSSVKKIAQSFIRLTAAVATAATHSTAHSATKPTTSETPADDVLAAIPQTVRRPSDDDAATVPAVPKSPKPVTVSAVATVSVSAVSAVSVSAVSIVVSAAVIFGGLATAQAKGDCDHERRA